MILNIRDWNRSDGRLEHEVDFTALSGSEILLVGLLHVGKVFDLLFDSYMHGFGVDVEYVQLRYEEGEVSAVYFNGQAIRRRYGSMRRYKDRVEDIRYRSSSSPA